MIRRRRTPPRPPSETDAGAGSAPPAVAAATRPPRQAGLAPAAPPAPGEPSLEALPVAGFSRRRVGFALGIFVTAWVVVVFARQVGDAAAAQTHADQVRHDNTILAAQVAALDRERTFIQTEPFIAFEARAYGLGGPKERPFSLAPDASALPSDAPGSAAVRIGAPAATPSPLESWLSLLFGPATERN
jgi:hypothetical protein